MYLLAGPTVGQGMKNDEQTQYLAVLSKVNTYESILLFYYIVIIKMF